MLLFERLSDQSHMTELEKSIANYFLNVGHHLDKKSSRSIASELFVSPSTISRFCQLVGCSGFNQFKESYLKDLKYLDSHFQEINPIMKLMSFVLGCKWVFMLMMTKQNFKLCTIYL